MRHAAWILAVGALAMFATAQPSTQGATPETRKLHLLEEQLFNTSEDFHQLAGSTPRVVKQAFADLARRLRDSSTTAHSVVSSASDLIILREAAVCADDRSTLAGLVSARWVRYGGMLQSLGRNLDRDLSFLRTAANDAAAGGADGAAEMTALATRYRDLLSEAEKMLKTAMVEP